MLVIKVISGFHNIVILWGFMKARTLPSTSISLHCDSSHDKQATTASSKLQWKELDINDKLNHRSWFRLNDKCSLYMPSIFHEICGALPDMLDKVWHNREASGIMHLVLLHQKGFVVPITIGVKQCTFRWLISLYIVHRDMVFASLFIHHLIVITCISCEIIFTISLPKLINIAALSTFVIYVTDSIRHCNTDYSGLY